MDSTSDETLTKKEQLRQLVASARKDIEDSAIKSKRMADALDNFLNDRAKDVQEGVNL